VEEAAVSESIPQMTDPRVAGGVRRYHTWPVVHQQTNAEHQWNVARIVLAIWPGAPRQLIFAALFHDIGELATGDLPYPVKKDNPDLKKTCDEVEHSHHLKMCMPWSLPTPTTCAGLDKRVLKLADLTDMYEYALEELLLGNRNASAIVERVVPPIKEIIRELMRGGDDEAQRCGVRAEEYIARRSRTFNEAGGQS
jgi:5'-deoxynucleotidase YfbR-like HD superfamily hydrolase